MISKESTKAMTNIKHTHRQRRRNSSRRQADRHARRRWRQRFPRQDGPGAAGREMGPGSRSQRTPTAIPPSPYPFQRFNHRFFIFRCPPQASRCSHKHTFFLHSMPTNLPNLQKSDWNRGPEIVDRFHPRPVRFQGGCERLT